MGSQHKIQKPIFSQMLNLKSFESEEKLLNILDADIEIIDEGNKIKIEENVNDYNTFLPDQSSIAKSMSFTNNK